MPSLRILLVVNAFASSVTARNTVVVHRALGKGHDIEVVETNRRGHATRIAQDGARRGVDVVVAFGGDGTLNEVTTGCDEAVETSLGARRLLWNLLLIERRLGRVRTVRWGPRTIDLDLLLYGNQLIEHPALVVPHPRLHDRRFVLMPLNELDPLLIHPSLQRTATQLLTDSTDRSEVRLLFPQPSTRYGSRPSCSPSPDL